MSAERIPLQADLSEAVGRALCGPEVIVHDGGTDAAVVISMDKYRRLQQLEDGEDQRKVREALERRHQPQPGTMELDGPDAVDAWFAAL